MATSSGSGNGGEQIDVEMPEFLRIPPSDIKIDIGDPIGRGGFSTVHKALWRGKQCAAKIVQTANVLAIQKEVAILSKLSHPHIMGSLGFSVDSTGDLSRCMILMELMESDLRHLMDEHLAHLAKDALPFSETEAVDIICQISSGMEYLHGQGVFHGDLKASNVLVSRDCDGKLHVKITDFGVSQMVKLDPAEKSEDFMRKEHFRGAVGTRGYQAPEVSSSSVMVSEFGCTFRERIRTLVYEYPGDFESPEREPEVYRISPKVHRREPERYRIRPKVHRRQTKVYKRKPHEFYSAKADIYCFAITCSEIFTGRIPFESISKPDIPELVLQGARPELPHGLDRRLVALINVCWDKNPSKRPRFSDIRRSLEKYSSDGNGKRALKRWGRLLRRSLRGMWK